MPIKTNINNPCTSSCSHLKPHIPLIVNQKKSFALNESHPSNSAYATNALNIIKGTHALIDKYREIWLFLNNPEY